MTAERMLPAANPYRTDVGLFYRARVGAFIGRILNRDEAIARGKEAARDADLRVVDVAYATLQQDGSWVVELQVVTDGRS